MATLHGPRHLHSASPSVHAEEIRQIDSALVRIDAAFQPLNDPVLEPLDWDDGTAADQIMRNVATLLARRRWHQRILKEMVG